MELKSEARFHADDIDKIEIQIFDVAYNIIGGGEEGEKTNVRTKEQADHSLQYITAVAILDDQVMPEQYSPDRIVRSDVQELLRKVDVSPRRDFSERFPNEMPCHLKVHLKDGRVYEKEKRDYEGFFTRPMTWKQAVEKFQRLSNLRVDGDVRKDIVTSVAKIEDVKVEDMTGLLELIPRSKMGP